MRSKECEVADLFITAFSSNDIETLDKAKKSVQINYLDREVQAIARKISLLASEFEDDPPSASKASTSSSSGKTPSIPAKKSSAVIDAEKEEEEMQRNKALLFSSKPKKTVPEAENTHVSAAEPEDNGDDLTGLEKGISPRIVFVTIVFHIFCFSYEYVE